jgi:hypothetical protein
MREPTDIFEMPENPSDAEKLAQRYVWWQPISQTLENPGRLLCQILSIGTAEDYLMGLELWGEQAFRDALRDALPGAVDDRSWAFWRRYYGLKIPPPLRRNFGRRPVATHV